MSADDDPEVLKKRLYDNITRGDALRDSGQAEAALGLWDEVLMRSSEVEIEDGAALSGMALGRKAHLLLTLGGAIEAERLAGQAAERLASVSGTNARLLGANALSTQSSALIEMGQAEATVAINEQLVSLAKSDESFALKVIAGPALRHEIWMYGQRNDQAHAIVTAQRLVELLGIDDDPEHLVDVVELLLSGAEMLPHGPIWRRTSSEVNDQIRAMCDRVLEIARRVGGDLGEAAAINAQRTMVDALVSDHRWRATLEREHPSVSESALPALEQMEDAARQAGSEQRHLNLVMIRATTLAELGRIDEAVQALDDLLDDFNTRNRTLNATGPTAIKAMRKLIASQR